MKKQNNIKASAVYSESSGVKGFYMPECEVYFNDNKNEIVITLLGNNKKDTLSIKFIKNK